MPKYEYKTLNSPIWDATCTGIQTICGYSGPEEIEMNVRNDHVYLIVMVRPKIVISDFMSRLKGQMAIKTFKQFPSLKEKPYWGNEF